MQLYSHIVETSVLCGYLLLMPLCIANSDVTFWFKNPPYENSVASIPTITKQPIFSVVECAGACVHRGIECVNFVFDKDTKSCHMSNGLVTGMSGMAFGRKACSCQIWDKCTLDESNCLETIQYEAARILTVVKRSAHKEECASSNGYLLHGNRVCMKIHHGAWYDYDSAVESCRLEGAHLLLIEDEAMYQLIKGVLTDVGTADKVMIDGYRVTTDDPFLSWKQKPMPYVFWAANQPEAGGRKCLKLLSPTYEYKSATCIEGADPRDVVCQKEVW